MADYVLFEQKGHLAYITINRPERMNALGQDVRNGLIDAFMKVRHEPSIRVAIITGAGEKAFSAGADLKEHNEIFKKKSYRVEADYGALDERKNAQGPGLRRGSKKETLRPGAGFRRRNERHGTGSDQPTSGCH